MTRTLRDLRGKLTQAQAAEAIARRLGRPVTQHEVCRWERGSQPRADVLLAMAAAYGVSAESILIAAAG